MLPIIAKNATGDSISIEDLGISIGGHSQIDLLNIFTKSEVVQSRDLVPFVLDGDIIINDGNKDLNPTEGYQHITFKTAHETEEEHIPDYLTVKEDDIIISDTVQELNFKGATVSQDSTSQVSIEITGGGGGEITIKDEGSIVSNTIDTINVSGVDLDVQLDSANEITLLHTPNYLTVEDNGVLVSNTIDTIDIINAHIIQNSSSKITIDHLKHFDFQVKIAAASMSSSSWFDSNESDYSCGSWSGFTANKVSPIIAPYNSKLSRVAIRLRGAAYNWMSAPGTLHLSLGFYTMQYNGATLLNSFRVDLQGTYSGSSFDYESHLSVVDTFTMNSGTNYFPEGSLLGVMFRTDTGGEGRINTLRYPFIKMYFEEVK